MGVKFYCDVCGEEISKKIAGRSLETKWKNVQTRVVVAIDDVWNGGHICQTCLLKAVVGGEKSYRA